MLLTTIFFHSATFESLHDTLESLGAQSESHSIQGESFWVLQTGDGAINLHVIEDFDRYSVELWMGVLLKLAPAYAALGKTPRLALEVDSETDSEEAARQLVHDIMAIHPGVSHEDPHPSAPLDPEKWAEAGRMMG